MLSGHVSSLLSELPRRAGSDDTRYSERDTGILCSCTGKHIRYVKRSVLFAVYDMSEALAISRRRTLANKREFESPLTRTKPDNTAERHGAI